MSQENEGDAGRRAKGNWGAGRTIAEWTTLGTSVLILFAVIVLLSYEYFASSARQPVVEAQPQLEEIRQAGGAYYLPVDVTNRGERTAEDVRVQVSLSSGQGQQETSQFSLKFLAGSATERGTVIFREDPLKGNITVDAISFRKP